MLPGHAIGLAFPNSWSRGCDAKFAFGLGDVHPPAHPDGVDATASGAAQSPNPSSSSAHGEWLVMVGIRGELDTDRKARGGGSRSDLVDLVGDGGAFWSLSLSAVHGEPHGSSILSKFNYHVVRGFAIYSWRSISFQDRRYAVDKLDGMFKSSLVFRTCNRESGVSAGGRRTGVCFVEFWQGSKAALVVGSSATGIRGKVSIKPLNLRR